MGFSIDELWYVTIGQVLDYMVEYVESKSKEGKQKKTKTRKATQADFDAF